LKQGGASRRRGGAEKQAAETAQQAQKRMHDEDGKRKQFETGELSLDMYNMCEGLKKA